MLLEVLDRQISYNTVFTSAIGNTGLHDYPLVTKEAEIVVAHGDSFSSLCFSFRFVLPNLSISYGF